jgi:hypothetical protein
VNSIHYRKFKGNKCGQCRICLKERHLTWDHVPPQCVIPPEPWEMVGLLEYLQEEERREVPFISQNGVKFRTICDSCRSSVAQYDRALQEFSDFVRRLHSTKVELLDRVEIECRPTAMIRSVLSHLLTVNLTGHDGTFDSIARQVIQNKDMPIPRELNVYYWFFPAQHVVAIKSFSMYRVGRLVDAVGAFSLLKFFPLGFLVSDLSSFEGLPSLSQWGSLPASAKATIPFDLKSRPRLAWPERPADETIICINAEETIGAHPRRIRKGAWTLGKMKRARGAAEPEPSNGQLRRR